MNTLTAHEMPLEHGARGQDAIVYGSIALIAAATGLGVYYEAGAANWLSVTAGSVTALLLAAGHLRLAAPKTRPSSSQQKRATTKQPTAQVPKTLDQSVPAQLLQPQSLPERTHPAEAQRPDEIPVSPPVLSTFPLRQPTHGLPPSKVGPAALQAKPDMELAQLELLVRQMAQSVGGPQAGSPDPDHQKFSDLAPDSRHTDSRHTDFRHPEHGHPAVHKDALAAAPALRVGFGATAVASTTGARVATAIAAERLDILLAPIQSLTEQRASHFEVFMRLRDEHGEVLSDTDVAEAARTTGLAGAIDALRLPRVARVARKVQARGGTPADVLTDVFGDSLIDKAFIDALDVAMTGTTPPPVVLAFSHADIRAFGRVHWWALAALTDLGLHFAISDLTDLDLDFDLLAARGFTFAKLDADVFLNGLPHGPTVIPPADLTRYLATNGLQIIVGSINAQDQMERVAACGVSLGQGALFGTPKPVRREILQG